MTPAALEEMKEKQRTLAELQEQLSRLQTGVTKLEEAADSSNDSFPIDPTLLELLTDEGASENALPAPNQLSGIADQKLLNLFAPADLKLTSTTQTTTIRRQVHAYHRIYLEAPTLTSFGAGFFMVINSETLAIQEIRFEYTLKQGRALNYSLRPRHPVLYSWIEKRLKHDSFHRLDLGSLVWGIGGYYLEAQKRAKAFADLTQRLLDPAKPRHASTKVPQQVDQSKNAIKLRQQIFARNTYVVDLDHLLGPESSQTGTRKAHTASGRKLLLTWNIDLDWTGSARSTIDVVTTGLPAAADKGVKEAFGMLVKNSDVLEAMERVVTLLGNNA